MSLIWRMLNDQEASASWDAALLRLADYTPFQSYAWGQYRKSLGWEPCYWAAFDKSEKIVAMMLGSLRRYPLGFGLIYCEGGPIGDLSVCDESLQEAMKRTTGLNRLYCRFRCDRERSANDALKLSAKGWVRSWFNITCCFSMTLDLTQDETRTLAACEHTWRRNLRRAHEANLSFRQWLDPNVDEVLAVYSSMQSVKGLEEQHSREEVEQLLTHFNRNLVLYRCDDENGELLSVLGWVVFGDRAWAWFCATSEEGRKVQASFGILWAVIQHCQRLGVESVDLAGIDPVVNHGVYRFKKGIGGVPLEYLGEWDWATSPWLRWLGNWGISRRQQVAKATKLTQRALPEVMKPVVGSSNVTAENRQPRARVA
jgi:hypothetical protein